MKSVEGFVGFWLILALITKVSGHAQLVIRFDEYVNSDGELANGHCCDGKYIFCESGGGCDHYFIVCVDTLDGSDDMNKCHYGNITTGVTSERKSIVFGEDIGGTPNPILMNVPSWNRGAKIKVDVYDSDSNKDDFVDNLMYYYRAVPWDEDETAILVDRTQLQLTLEVNCARSWYGPQCHVFCSPGATYDCEPVTGDKLCYPGWTGDECDVDIDECESSPCKNGGLCLDQVNGYTCGCPPDVVGFHCQFNVTELSGYRCSRGAACVGDSGHLQCMCEAGWTGASCETLLNGE